MAVEGTVALAVVTCRGLGVLLARRVDGNPPWAFPGGKSEPGETAVAAAVREVAEETGLAVRATGLIGERVHPSTARTVVYVAAEPTDDTTAAALEGSGLAEVRWATAEEADALIGRTMFGLAREHIRRALAARPSHPPVNPGNRPGLAYSGLMSAMPSEPPPSPLDPARILQALPESDREDFLAAYRQGLADAADPAGFSALLRLLRLWSMHAEAAARPGYAEAVEAVNGPVGDGMYLEDLLRSR